MVLKAKPINKEKLTFDYVCYICGNILGKATQVINHVEHLHGYRLPGRLVGRKRPTDPLYEYVNNPASEEEYDLAHYACCSCWFHCPEAGLKEISDHINETHEPQNTDPSKNKNGEIKGGEATNIEYNRTAMAQRGSDSQGETDSDEEMPGADAGDIYRKLDELTDMLKKLLFKKSNDEKC